MRLILKIIAIPVIVILTVLVWVCSGLLYCSSVIFGIVSSLIAVLGVAVLATYSIQNGVILLVIAVLVSPLGLPMMAAKLLAKCQDVNYAIKDFIRVG